jgi:hypothetical protein
VKKEIPVEKIVEREVVVKKEVAVPTPVPVSEIGTQHAAHHA